MACAVITSAMPLHVKPIIMSKTVNVLKIPTPTVTALIVQFPMALAFVNRVNASIPVTPNITCLLPATHAKKIP
jgi:hypothetical protein